MRRRYVRKGDYLVPVEDLKEAEESFHKRSRRSRSMDRLTRAPIETDVEVWKESQRWMDYPGVDTPRRHVVKRSLLDERMEASRKKPGSVLVDQQDETFLGSIEESSDWPEDLWVNVRDAFKI